MKFKSFPVILIFLIAVVSCTNPDTENPANELINVEKDFCDMSIEKGIRAAFEHFAHREGVILRENRYPIVGKDSIAMSMKNLTDSLFTLTWKPLKAYLAESGDLGFTYGLYTLKMKDGSSESEGTYVTIWKKGENGNWRYLLDTGNEGLGY